MSRYQHSTNFCIFKINLLSPTDIHPIICWEIIQFPSIKFGKQFSKYILWPLSYVFFARFLFKINVSEARKEKIFEKNNSKYLNILSF